MPPPGFEPGTTLPKSAVIIRFTTRAEDVTLHAFAVVFKKKFLPELHFSQVIHSAKLDPQAAFIIGAFLNQQTGGFKDSLFEILDLEEKKVIEILRKGEIHIDELILLTSFPARKINEIISSLEIQGFIKENNGLLSIL